MKHNWKSHSPLLPPVSERTHWPSRTQETTVPWTEELSFREAEPEFLNDSHIKIYNKFFDTKAQNLEKNAWAKDKIWASRSSTKSLGPHKRLS